MSFKLSKPAEKDIEDILRYTLRRWGRTQFDHYFGLINATLNDIGKEPHCLSCRSRDDLFQGCLSKSLGKHIVFYRVVRGQVEVVRILHQMMDHPAQF